MTINCCLFPLESAFFPRKLPRIIGCFRLSRSVTHGYDALTFNWPANGARPGGNFIPESLSGTEQRIIIAGMTDIQCFVLFYFRSAGTFGPQSCENGTARRQTVSHSHLSYNTQPSRHSRSSSARRSLISLNISHFRRTCERFKCRKYEIYRCKIIVSRFLHFST